MSSTGNEELVDVLVVVVVVVVVSFGCPVPFPMHQQPIIFYVIIISLVSHQISGHYNTLLTLSFDTEEL